MHTHLHYLGLILLASTCSAHAERPLPVLNLPDPKIAEVYRGNWENTLKPCIEPPSDVLEPKDRDSEPQRPWRVDVDGHYPGWYPGVDMKHSAAAYLACQKDLDLVLRAWKVTTERYQMPDGAIRAMTMNGNPNEVVPETTISGDVVYYPLRLTGAIDYLLLGNMIFRFSQDKQWLAENIDYMRKTAAYIEGWIDDEGLLHSDSYDLDQVYREIDGVAQASAGLAFKRLADLEDALVSRDNGAQNHSRGHDQFFHVVNQLTAGLKRHFYDAGRGYYLEHLAYNNIVPGGVSSVSTSGDLDAGHDGAKAADGVLGRGMDAFGAGTGAAGTSEWATDEGAGAWIELQLRGPIKLGQIILFNRTAPGLTPADRIAEGRLEFSDHGAPVTVTFNGLAISRAVANLHGRTLDLAEPDSEGKRRVPSVRFTITKLQGEGAGRPGLSEFMIMPADAPYRKFTHGMTDTNFAVVGFGGGEPEQAASVWQYFRANEPKFYEVNTLHAPTWIAEDTESYGDGELNRRAPRKDCVAMGRTWRYDAKMRNVMHDGDGLYRTIAFANALYDRPSGGGPGFFAERYGLGRFQPGDESQANVLKYAEYPAVYNSTVIQECLLGLSVDRLGRICSAPCVPAAWYGQGFGVENPGLLRDRDLGIQYNADHVEGWVSGAAGPQALWIVPPPGLDAKACVVTVGGQPVASDVQAGGIAFVVPVSEHARSNFRIAASVR